MNPKDIFKLAVRLLGLFLIYQCLNNLPAMLQMIFVANIFAGFLMLLWAAANCAIAWWLIGGAPQLVRRAYPDGDANPESVGEKSNP